MLFQIKQIDREIYRNQIVDFLPQRIIDIHTHVWLNRHKKHTERDHSRVVSWPVLVAEDNSIEDHMETYRLMFPGKKVEPLIFSSVGPADDIDELNRYIGNTAAAHQIPALLYSHPTWSAADLERRIIDGGFVGIKSYLNLTPDYLPKNEIRIFDFFPPHQLEVMDRHRWLVMLHIPRDGRLRDWVNLAQMIEIDRHFSNAYVIIAHVGRAYCPEDVGDAFEVLAGTKNLLFDFSANTNSWVFEGLINAVGPGRILFGSDLPILRMRMRRICKDGLYVNLVPKGLYGDVSMDKNMGEVEGSEAESLTFFMYEEILAFKRAAKAVDLSADDILGVFYGNGARVLRNAGFDGPL